MKINNWLNFNIADRLDFYKSSKSASHFDRNNKETLEFVSELIENKGIDCDVFIESLI